MSFKMEMFSQCFNTQPPEGGWLHRQIVEPPNIQVSTHSRLKAAGPNRLHFKFRKYSFNTQPPEGGWQIKKMSNQAMSLVSTHSRLKAAGQTA